MVFTIILLSLWYKAKLSPRISRLKNCDACPKLPQNSPGLDVSNNLIHSSNHLIL